MSNQTKPPSPPRRHTPTATHCGNFGVETTGDTIVAVHGYADDPHPSPIGRSLTDSRNPAVRIDQPMVRESYSDFGTAIQLIAPCGQALMQAWQRMQVSGSMTSAL